MMRNTFPAHSNILYRNIANGFDMGKLIANSSPKIIEKPILKPAIPGSYSLSLTIFEHTVKVGKSMIVLERACWAFSNPKAWINPFIFSNSVAISHSFVLGRQWIADNIVFDTEVNKQCFFNFLDSKPTLLSWLNTSPEALIIADSIVKLLKENTSGDTVKLEIESLRLIQLFFDNCFKDRRIENNLSFSGSDYRNIVRAEKVILDHLDEPFIGIDAIAAEVRMSATKLKAHFRDMYGYSILQYHKENNLLFARQLLERSGARISAIAMATGYDSPAKFAAAFKKRFGILPSAFRASLLIK